MPLQRDALDYLLSDPGEARKGGHALRDEAHRNANHG